MAKVNAKKARDFALKEIQSRTHKQVSIRPDAPTRRLRFGIRRQRASRFFKLPAELRLRIYELIFAPYDDVSYPYKSTEAHYRPGYEARHQTCATFLSACRRVWLEANHLPLKLAAHTFWFFRGPFDAQRLRENPAALRDNRHPPVPTEADRYHDFFRKLTTLNSTHLNQVHIFASLGWLTLLAPFNMSTLNQRFSPRWFAGR